MYRHAYSRVCVCVLTLTMYIIGTGVAQSCKPTMGTHTMQSMQGEMLASISTFALGPTVALGPCSGEGRFSCEGAG